MKKDTHTHTHTTEKTFRISQTFQFHLAYTVYYQNTNYTKLSKFGMPDSVLFSIFPASVLAVFGMKRERDTLIGEEQMEEYRMLSGLEPSEIINYYIFFEGHKDTNNKLPKDVFMKFKCIEFNPLQVCARREFTSDEY